MAINCASCGSSNLDAARFCESCGAAVRSSAAPRPAASLDRRQVGYDHTSGTLALIIAVVCLVILAGALFSGLSLNTDDLNVDSGDETWKLRLKIVGLSGFGSFSVFPDSGGAIAVGATLLLALVMGRPRHGPCRADVAIVSTIAGIWLAIASLLSVLVDVTLFGDAAGQGGLVFGLLLKDVGATALAMVAAAWSARAWSSRDHAVVT